MGISHFEKYEKIALQLAKDENKLTHHLEQIGAELAMEFEQNGFIRKRPKEMLQLHPYSFVTFLSHLLFLQDSKKRVKSPVEKKKNSSWMADSSFCFLNVRGTGLSPEETGNFVDAVRILPCLRVDSIHLAPFFENALEIIYGVDSLSAVDEHTVHPYFLEKGMSAEEQVRFFTDSCHLMGKTVGFDIEPHTSQFSRIAIENPKHFRWLKLSADKKTLFGNVLQTDMLKEENQVPIREEITELKKSILEKYKISSLEILGADKTTKAAHMELIFAMIEKGLWALPSHTWKGAGLPEFSHYENKKDSCEYPEFKYLSTEGENHRDHAFGTLTPFAFYSGLPLNSEPSSAEGLKIRKSTVKYFANIFPQLFQRFRFDYIRFDYVDHVFDSVIDKKGKFPNADRMTPFVLKKTIDTARQKCGNFVGAMAERMGSDIEDYATCGFDLLLGTDVLRKIENDFVKDTVNQNAELHRINRKRKKKVNIQFAVDSHDTGHPLFQMTPMDLYGRKGVALRHFLARFAGAGKGIRSKYEVIGNQDGTTGLYKANNEICSVEWKNNKSMNDTYHAIEDCFEQYKLYLQNSKPAKFFEENSHTCGFIMKGKGYRIIAVLNTSQYTASDEIEIASDEEFKSIRVIDPYTNSVETTQRLFVPHLTPLSVCLFFAETKS